MIFLLLACALHRSVSDGVEARPKTSCLVGKLLDLALNRLDLIALNIRKMHAPIPFFLSHAHGVA